MPAGNGAGVGAVGGGADVTSGAGAGAMSRHRNAVHDGVDDADAIAAGHKDRYRNAVALLWLSGRSPLRLRMTPHVTCPPNALHGFRGLSIIRLPNSRVSSMRDF